jgi:glutathione S-transferase
MQLAVSAWYPYQHQATAFGQLLGDLTIERVPLEEVSTSLANAAIGPFVALLTDDDALPLLGLPSIVETIHRRHPELALLPADPIVRARARAFATMIEERFTRYCVADLATHESFGRRLWNTASDAPERILETPPDLDGLETIAAHEDMPFLGGDRPGLADALLAALWWTLEDQGRDGDLSRYPWLSDWYARSCDGAPFGRAG